ncbi:MAG: hypothetical protein KAJ81_03510, partial [Candidatus Latescibacteria bacterium]|nr:hypothetical protein [Candidatus Latescibacterota bacterium]
PLYECHVEHLLFMDLWLRVYLRCFRARLLSKAKPVPVHKKEDMIRQKPLCLNLDEFFYFEDV